VAVATGKLCPVGWRIPTDDDWKTLEKFLGMTETDCNNKTWRGSDQGAQLKSTSGWGSGNGTNTTGFNALPGGFRQYNDSAFIFLGDDGYWWTASPEGTDMGWIRGMSTAFQQVYRDIFPQGTGLAVRCIKN
jgi:uncharacterized protein (TIGR02145 family)